VGSLLIGMIKIPFSDFSKLDMRVGKIIKVEDHPNADKLFVMTVDLGEEERTIVAGLKGFYSKEELEGKSSIFVVNLEPVSLRGVESNGMIMAASNGPADKKSAGPKTSEGQGEVSGDKFEVKILIVDGDLEPGSRVS